LSFRHIRPGFERIPAGEGRPRHAHFSPYVSIVLDGGYDQASYAGRMRLEPGDVLVQPVLDRHDSRMPGRRGTHLLRLAWGMEPGLGGVFRPAAADLVIRAAERDPTEASGLLAELLRDAKPQPMAIHDWPDQLAADLRDGPGMRLGDWAQARGLARETVARGFSRSFGASARTFAKELRARDAWLRIVSERAGLATIAAELGYADQPHMTCAVRALTGAPPDLWRRRLAAQGLGA
jgi:AraC-like DNA-binding protein